MTKKTCYAKNSVVLQDSSMPKNKRDARVDKKSPVAGYCEKDIRKSGGDAVDTAPRCADARLRGDGRWWYLAPVSNPPMLAVWNSISLLSLVVLLISLRSPSLTCADAFLFSPLGGLLGIGVWPVCLLALRRSVTSGKDAADVEG